MSAGQESGSPIRENRTLLPAPLPPDEARGTLAAAAGVSTVGLRPPFDTPAAAFSSRLSRYPLSALYPRARVAHAYASTEAGVLFEIEDGQAGFPRTLLEKRVRDIALKVVDSTLHARSSGSALRYLGATPPRLFDQAGFIDTGDFVHRQGDRYFFSGRRGGIINVGGAKVNPEEVEAIINQHASVHASLVKARRNPIAGSVVVADVVLKEGVVETAELNEEIRSECATRLAPYKVPALVRFVPNLDVTDAGKLRRN